MVVTPRSTRRDQVCGSGRPRGGAHLRAVPPLSTMADIYDRAEELNQVSALYNVEIDGVPLQQMSTNELAKVRCAPHAPLDVAVELAHFARDASPGDASSLTITAPAPAVPFRFRSLRRVVYP